MYFYLSRQSLAQLKETNTQLALQNKQLQAQISFSEQERREAERKLNSTTLKAGDKESQVNLLKSEISSLKEKLLKNEAEKKRLEKCYSQVEKERSCLRKELEEMERKSDKSIPFVSSNVKPNGDLIDEAKTISHGLAALEQRNIELQKKVQDLQSIMNEADSTAEGIQIKENGILNANKKTTDRLKSAQKQAEQLLDSKNKFSSHQDIESLENKLADGQSVFCKFFK